MNINLTEAVVTAVLALITTLVTTWGARKLDRAKAVSELSTSALQWTKEFKEDLEKTQTKLEYERNRRITECTEKITELHTQLQREVVRNDTLEAQLREEREAKQILEGRMTMLEQENLELTRQIEQLQKRRPIRRTP